MSFDPDETTMKFRMLMLFLLFAQHDGLRLNTAPVFDSEYTNDDGVSFESKQHSVEIDELPNAIQSMEISSPNSLSKRNLTNAPKRYNSTAFFDGAPSRFASKEPKSIFFFGSSIDRKSMRDACARKGQKAKVEKDRARAHCKLGDFSFVWVQNPGSGEPPYWNHEVLLKQGVPVQDTQSAYLQNYAKDYVAKHIGSDGGTKSPDFIVVDSTLWDLAAFWQNDHDVTEKTLDKWCHDSVPEQLKLIRDTFPDSRIVLRTAPATVGKTSNWKGELSQDNNALNYMSGCIATELGKAHDVIDVHSIAEEYMLKFGANKAYEKDGFHPSSRINVEYMNEVLNYVAEKRPDN